MPIPKDEAHFSEAALFEELAEDVEVVLTPPRGVPLQIWENLEEQKIKA